MKKEKFDEIINFAIDGEKDAIRFYQYLQGLVKFSALRELLKDMENMEKGHIVILENIRSKGTDQIELKTVADIHISQYVPEVEIKENLSYQDILIIAMKKEEQAQNLYTDLAGNFAGTESEKIFLKLANEEAAHKLKFETLYDKYILKDN